MRIYYRLDFPYLNGGEMAQLILDALCVATAKNQKLNVAGTYTHIKATLNLNVKIVALDILSIIS